MGKKNKRNQGPASFEIPQRPKMVSEACSTPEASVASLEDNESSPSPRSDARSYTPESEDDEAPATKGDIKRLLVELRQVWREDLQKV
ncbi:Hypothetical predicted protein [Pelobates cultripes]|uniref:Uncharacterized protein n=1 Tax=Pelobates cultripes TaxID=61616 RepID=A0AAD1RFS7_PELCU|nr:Hypothetical predicted protein [Pelobates cultripes]